MSGYATDYANRSAFAVRLRGAMSKSGVLCVDLAAALGVSQPTVSYWRHGRTVPGEQLWEPLAHHLGCSVAWLRHGLVAEPRAEAAPQVYEPPVAVTLDEDERELSLLYRELAPVVAEELRLRKEIALVEARLHARRRAEEGRAA